MKYTNKRGFGPIVSAWLLTDNYDYIPGVYSASDLKSPTRQVILKDRYYDELEEDLSDLIARRYGTALHDSIDKVLEDQSFLKDYPDILEIEHEKRVFKTVYYIGGDKQEHTQEISGKFDGLVHYMDRYRLSDTKSCSVNKFIFRDYTEFVTQLSIYRFILLNHPDYMDKPIDQSADVILIFTDWHKSKAQTEPDYPDCRIMEITIDLWDEEATYNYIVGRLEEIRKAKDLEDDHLPLCTDEELWRRDTTWAVFKGDNQRATKVFTQEDEAKLFCELKGPAYHIVYRPGKAVRCFTYCPCWVKCNQYQMLQEEGVVDGPLTDVP